MNPSAPNNNARQLTLQITATALMMLAGMTAYEIIKQIIFPRVTIWESHAMTIVFSTICAVVAGSIILVRQNRLTDALIRSNIEGEQLRRELDKTIHQLQQSLSTIETLSGLLPICAACKKIRDDGGNWIPMETYIEKRSDVRFSHSLCTECGRQLYPEDGDLFRN
jgi:hypothetical protein